MSCRNHETQPAKCCCRRCQDLLCNGCWAEHRVNEYGLYPEELHVEDAESVNAQPYYAHVDSSTDPASSRPSDMTEPADPPPQHEALRTMPQLTEGSGSSSAPTIYTPPASETQQDNNSYFTPAASPNDENVDDDNDDDHDDEGDDGDDGDEGNYGDDGHGHDYANDEIMSDAPGNSSMNWYPSGPYQWSSEDLYDPAAARAACAQDYLTQTYRDDESSDSDSDSE